MNDPSSSHESPPEYSSQDSPHPTAAGRTHHYQAFWLWVMCLTGLDYFSTLGYQPSIAYVNAGLLAPLATVVLVAVTLLGAFPVYAYVARRCSDGQGSIGMLNSLLSGWSGKILVLVILGFAVTDFVITKTLSAADAAKHMIENPHWPLKTETADEAANQQLWVTIILLCLLGGVFLKGFREVIGLAVAIVGTYLLLNAVVIGAGLLYTAKHRELLHQWWEHVLQRDWHMPQVPGNLGGNIWEIGLVVMLIFPKLALGLSGFETAVAVMPWIRGDPGDTPEQPAGRIRNTRYLLLTAALIMSVALLGSSLTVSILILPEHLLYPDPDRPGQFIPPEDWPADRPKPKAPANERALAYLAHNEGPHRILPDSWSQWFGTAYDLSTVVILWFAGASAMAGLLNLIPKYLPRYGMAPEWVRATRPLVLLLTAINLTVTWIFQADVTAQGDAYATGVLVLITSACVATVIDRWRHHEGSWRQKLSLPYLLITLVFVYTTLAVVIEKPVGLKIATFFISAILITSFVSRIVRSRELRFAGFRMADPQSKLLWDTIRHLEISILVPHRPGRRSLVEKEAAIRREHRIPSDLMIVFVEVHLADPSEFIAEPVMEVYQEQGRFVVKITQAASIAHTLAAVALEMAKVGQPPEIHFGWPEETLWSGTLGFLLFGEGNIPWIVREIIHRAQPDPSRRPFISIAGT